MMSGFTLVDKCIGRVAHLLKECYWPVNCYSTDLTEYDNPFSSLPPHINEELITAVVQLVPSGTLSIRHLYLVLSSGRIKTFKLEDVLVATDEVVNILTSLSVHGMHLTKLIFQKVYCYAEDGTHNKRMYSTLCSAIELLLSMSPNLEHIEIDKEFDLKVIQRICSLKHLELNFVPQNKLYDLIPRISDYVFIPNETLTYFSVFENYQHQIPVEEISFLLEYCPELTCIGNSIAGALEFLHGEELFRGSLTKQYKLQKYVLGNVLVSPSEGVSTVPILHIAALTCPNTRELDILVNDHHAISVLSDFKKLESVLVQWEKATSGDFRLALQPVIESIGPQLRDLCILNFSNVDFEAIGRSCPSLQEFKIEYDNEVDVSDPSLSYFEGLTGLHVQCEALAGVKSDTLLLLLGSCHELTSLCLDNVRFLTDDLLGVLLRRNQLLKLKELSVAYCSLTADGLKLLIKSSPVIEFLCFNSPLVPFDEVVDIVHNINPFIIVSAKV